MTRLFILVKRKGAKTWRGAIPAKRKISKARLQKTLRKSIKKGFVAKIVSERQLKKLLLRMAPATVRRSLVGKRRKITKRKKRRR